MDIIKFAHLLARLAYEDDFRQRFVTAPAQALADMGIDPETARLPAPPFELPSKERLQKEHELLLQRFAKETTQPMHVLI